MGVRLQKNILLIAAISSLRAFPSLSKILSRRFSGKVWRPFLTDPLVFLSSLLHCKSFVRQCSQRCCAESGQTVFAPSGWFSFSASKTSPERLREPGEFSLSRRFIAADSFPWKTNIQDASDVSSILNSASYRMAALDEVTEASAATERTMKNLPQIGTKMGVKRPILQKL